MKGRAPTVDEKRFMDEICQLGCIACFVMGYETPQVTPHHIDGRVKTGCHFHVIPLCGNHHQVPDSEKPPRWIAVHENKTEFQKRYGTEQELYLLCLELMNDRARYTEVIL